MSDDTVARPAFKTLLREIPSREKDQLEDEIAKLADEAHLGNRRSEAIRDAVVAVLFAIRRRGDDLITGWTVDDVETALAVGELLIDLGEKKKA
jgi:hypothetical protein